MPPSDAIVRRLRAVAVIDVAGYSRLMAVAEARTHVRVNELFSEVVDPAVEKHHGRRIERAGDGLLVLFESSTDAVRCAVAIQRATAELDVDAPAEHRLRLRIGINVGDIIIDGDEIAGDDVNIAARLQALAEPGTVCISAAVRSQLHEELDSTFEDLGNVVLKNIGRPVRVYQVRQRDHAALLPRLASLSHWRKLLVRNRRGVLAGSVAVAVVAGLLLAYRPDRPDPSSAEPPPMSVAVLPFADAGAPEVHAAQVQIANAVVRGLAASGWLQVTAPDVVERASSGVQGVPALRRILNVRYAVRGRVLSEGGKLVTEIELLDTGKGIAAWASRVEADDRQGAPGDIAMNVVVKLREALYDAEARRLFESGGVARTAMEHKMLGDSQRAHFLSLESERKSRRHYEDSLGIDPNFVPSMISLAYALLSEADLDPAAPAERLIQQVDDVSKRAIAQAPDSAPAWQLRSEALARQWMWAAAIDASDRSIALDPGRAFAHGQRASLMVRLGRPQDALAIADRASALAEQRSGFVLFQRCRALMALGEYRGAVDACQRSIASEEWWLQRAYLLSAYALLGEADRMAAEKARLMQQLPQLTLAQISALRQSNVEEFGRQMESNFLRGLRLAGIAEGR